MNNKTISFLNSKAWYRLLKVIFILIFLIVLVGYNIFVFSEIDVKNIDNGKTKIQCNVGTKIKFTPQSIGLNLNINDFKNGQFDYKKFYSGYNNYSIGEILTECYPKRDFSTDIYDGQKSIELMYKYGIISNSGIVASSTPIEQSNEYISEYTTYKQQTKDLLMSSKLRYLDFSFRSFDINPIFTYNNFLEYFFIGNLIIFFIFEFVRRCFYYVVLGTIKPKK